MSVKKDDLGKRMKEFYEERAKTKLIKRMPVAIRIDGKAFHTFTRGMKKPFDDILIKSMQDTMKYLCENIQGCVFGYTQSDEITLILLDYQTLTSSAWFDNEVQKICSISASMATLAFNRIFASYVNNWMKENILSTSNRAPEETIKYSNTLNTALKKGAMFDSRCFNIPKEEVTNLIYWRQNDASKNSIQMVGRAYFSDKELKSKNNSQVQDMLHEKFGINWNNFPTEQKRGGACKKNADGKWEIDHEMPILKNNDRHYLDNLIFI